MPRKTREQKNLEIMQKVMPHIDPLELFYSSVQNKIGKNGKIRRKYDMDLVDDKAKPYIKQVLSLTKPSDVKEFIKSGKYTGNVGWEVKITTSSGVIIRSRSFVVYQKTIPEIEERLRIIVSNYVEAIPNEDDLIDVSYNLSGVNINNKYTEGVITIDLNDIIDDEIKATQFIKLPIKLNANDTIIKDNCVSDALNNYRNSIKTIRSKVFKNAKFETSNWTLKKLLEKLEHISIPYKIYSQFGTLLKSSSVNKKLYPQFICIIGNNHLYHITKDELKLLKSYCSNKGFENESIKIVDVQPITSTNFEDEYNTNVVKYLVIEPYKKKDILTLVIGNNKNSNCTLYLEQSKYDAYKLYQDANIKTLITHKFKSITPLLAISKQNNLMSTMTKNWNRPKAIQTRLNHEIIAEQYNIKCKDYNKFVEIVSEELQKQGYDIYSIDKNKAYYSVLLNLDKLPIINEQCLSYPYSKRQPILPTNFYHIIKIDNSISPYLDYGYCSGYRLQHLDRNKYKCDYYISPELVNNPFKDILTKMYNTNKTVTKTIINSFIGYMQLHINEIESSSQVITNIFKNKNEADISGKLCMQFRNVYVAYDNIIHSTTHIKTNMLPIAHYIIDNCVNNILSTIKSLSTDNILKSLVSIKTDSITYIGKKPNFELNENNIGGFRYEKTEIKPKILFTLPHNRLTLLPEIPHFELDKSILGDCMAGSGKTYYIMNTILPTLDKENKTYLITCSQWAPIANYKKNKFVLQCFEKNFRPFQKYEYIIIDEAGLLSYKDWRWIYEHKTVNQKILAFGDKNQLLPVKNPNCINPLNSNLIQNLFDCKMIFNKNYRNGFKLDDYQNMMNNNFKIDKYECKYLLKRLSNEKINSIVNKSWNIVYTNTLRKKINEAKSADWDDTIEDKKIKIGARIICTTNDLRDYNIFNKMIFNVVSYDDLLILKCIHSNEQYTLQLSDYIYFDLAYALTLYCVQGMSIPYDDIMFHECEFIRTDIKNGLYVMYSRIENKKEALQQMEKQKKKSSHMTVSFD